MDKLYTYVGPHELCQLLRDSADRSGIRQPTDVLAWIAEAKQWLNADQAVTTTFVVAADGGLWIADRHSEHVVCARGAAVQTAGEITFEVRQQQVEVVAITNQSTGYCPEHESWWAVDAVLDRIAFAHPAYWTAAYIFRRCTRCATINIVKDEWYECAVCETPLSQTWNF